MWLLNARTLKLELFHGESVPPYAMLSHRWRADEVLYQDLADRADDPEVKARVGYQKIRNTCEQALEDGLDYVWTDTCCIDKRSSAELSKAINSMFRWYWRAQKCYAYLDDFGRLSRLSVPISELDEMSLEQNLSDSGFMESSWFTRGWTLQELLAPSDVRFYNKDWIGFGTRLDLSTFIKDITGIDKAVLERRSEIKNMSVATRMSWAAARKTTRIEDQAYSLLGIFGVNMPMLYGEGTRAFVRLQHEIIKSSTDQSILTWTGHNKSLDPEEAPQPIAAGILATSPADFTKCRRISYQGDIAVYQSYDLTNAGLRMTLPMVKYGTISWGILNCKQNGNLLGIQLEPIPAPQLPESMKRRTSDIKAYSIVPIRNNSHVKFMGHWDIPRAHWKDILIVGRTASPQQPADPRPLVGLRFVSRDTYNSKTRFQIISMIPSGVWDRLNMVQPSLLGYRIAVPFIPVADVAMGGIVLEDRSTRQRLAVYFRYEAAPQSTAFNPYCSFFVGMSALPASSKEFSMTWEEFCRTYLLAEAPENPNPPRPQISTSPIRIELTESTVELEGNIRMAAYLRAHGKANGERELELVFEELYDSNRFKQIKGIFKRKGSSTKD